ncbi:MAG: methionyl-tRNA formyltransferase [Thermodesulfovibrionales bacterium]
MTDRLRTVFISNGQNGFRVLEEILLHHPRFSVEALFTSPAPSGAAPISGYQSFDCIAARHSLPLHKTWRLQSSASMRTLRDLQPDIVFCIGWSRLLGRELLTLPRLGVIGMHPTLLPEGRGRAPIPWALIKGLARSGVTLFYLDEGADTGDIIAQKEFPILFEDDAATVYERAARTMVGLARENLPLLAGGTAPRVKQDDSRASTWPRRTPGDGRIGWSDTALSAYNFIRGLARPYPGAFTFCRGAKLFLWKSLIRDRESRNEPGVILELNPAAGSFTAACRRGALEIIAFDGIEFSELREGDMLG